MAAKNLRQNRRKKEKTHCKWAEAIKAEAEAEAGAGRGRGMCPVQRCVRVLSINNSWKGFGGGAKGRRAEKGKRQQTVLTLHAPLGLVQNCILSLDTRDKAKRKYIKCHTSVWASM